MSLIELTNSLAKGFDECLESILTVPESNKEGKKEEEVLKEPTASLRSTFLQLESRLKEIRMEALEDKELRLKETNRLLKRDIEIKRNAMDKYKHQLDRWDQAIPPLIEQAGRAMERRLNGTDFDSTLASPSPTQTTTQNEEEDEDEDIEFEEV
ncbi:hypothetical protein BY458DRAFT_527356 [Sporodiniella umbellata]|nr:hypothetical protein BY458DRAFT_527356 [Sporodiniella umbellata]